MWFPANFWKPWAASPNRNTHEDIPPLKETVSSTALRLFSNSPSRFHTAPLGLDHWTISTHEHAHKHDRHIRTGTGCSHSANPWIWKWRLQWVCVWGKQQQTEIVGERVCKDVKEECFKEIPHWFILPHLWSCVASLKLQSRSTNNVCLWCLFAAHIHKLSAVLPL